jgi:diguanylate cyclase (GGDEF)-like protein
MIKRCLKRFGLPTAVGIVTLLSIALSAAISATLHYAVLGIPMTSAAWIVTLACPAIIAPLMAGITFHLLLELDRAHDQLRELSNLDHLTGVHNRRLFMERLREEIERADRYGTPFSVAVIDVDDFKSINDRHGHLGGDELLRRLAQTCIEQVRQTDVFARIGGEEFALLLPHTGRDDALHLVERLRERVAELRVELHDALLGATVSIGLATPHARPASINGVLREADDALYAAKRQGKNRVVSQIAPPPRTVAAA